MSLIGHPCHLTKTRKQNTQNLNQRPEAQSSVEHKKNNLSKKGNSFEEMKGIGCCVGGVQGPGAWHWWEAELGNRVTGPEVGLCIPGALGGTQTGPWIPHV